MKKWLVAILAALSMTSTLAQTDPFVEVRDYGNYKLWLNPQSVSSLGLSPLIGIVIMDIRVTFKEPFMLTVEGETKPVNLLIDTVLTDCAKDRYIVLVQRAFLPDGQPAFFTSKPMSVDTPKNDLHPMHHVMTKSCEVLKNSGEAQ